MYLVDNIKMESDRYGTASDQELLKPYQSGVICNSTYSNTQSSPGVYCANFAKDFGTQAYYYFPEDTNGEYYHQNFSSYAEHVYSVTSNGPLSPHFMDCRFHEGLVPQRSTENKKASDGFTNVDYVLGNTGYVTNPVSPVLEFNQGNSENFSSNHSEFCFQSSDESTGELFNTSISIL